MATNPYNRLISTFIVCLALPVLVIVGCQSRGQTADTRQVAAEQSPNVFAILAGAWEGTLEYADFSDDSRSQIPVIVEITPLDLGEGARLRFQFIEPSGDTIRSAELHQLNREQRTYTIDGAAFQVTQISGFSTAAAGRLSWAGSEIENNQEVPLRQTIELRDGILTVQKETRAPLRFRNGLRLQRKQ